MSHLHEQHTHAFDALVLWITSALLALTCTVPVLQAIADSVQQEEVHTTIIVPGHADRDYTALLSYIFNTTDENQIAPDAEAYIRDVDTYRARVARGVVENKNLVNALTILINDLPADLAETHRNHLQDLTVTAHDHRTQVVRYVNSDTFLIKAVTDEYELEQRTLFEHLTQWLRQSTTVDSLSDLRQDSYNLRISLAKMYEKIQSYTKSKTA